MHRVSNKDKSYLGKPEVSKNQSAKDSEKSTPGTSIAVTDQAVIEKNSIEFKTDENEEDKKQTPKVKVDVVGPTSNGNMTKAEDSKETTVVRRNANKS